MGTIQIDGSTPKITVGNATAEDATILFDGNAQDFYIALDDSADDLLIGLGSTVGSTPAISIDENLQSTFGGDVIIGGATPTLTIGDAGEEDTKIVFDGNAQDFHIGLDDSADSLTIGLGNTLGTTSHIVIDATGAVTKPLQPYVYAYANADQTVTADDSITALELNAELKDINADFNTTTYTFTAPVDGAYMCSGYIQMIEDTDTSITDWFFGFNASNGGEKGWGGNPTVFETSSGSNYTKVVGFSKIVYMDASDTLTLYADCAGGGGSLTFKVDGTSNSYAATSMQVALLS